MLAGQRMGGRIESRNDGRCAESEDVIGGIVESRNRIPRVEGAAELSSMSKEVVKSRGFVRDEASRMHLSARSYAWLSTVGSLRL